MKRIVVEITVLDEAGSEMTVRLFVDVQGNIDTELDRLVTVAASRIKRAKV